METATFAAGCFWGAEAIFRGKRGVTDTSVGYMGGHFKNPTYEDVATDTTGHAEVTQVRFDPSVVAYTDLLRMFFKSHDPTSMYGTKRKYRTAIFVHSESQRAEAEAFIQTLSRSGRYRRPVRTAIGEATTYYPAEARHQHYYEKRASASTS